MIEEQLEALAVDTRRHIYSMLISQPRSVQEIADELPVSRPAVSQHLKVLVEAGLARASTVGTRRVYSADPAGVAEFRRWADHMWTAAIGRFADFAASSDEEKIMLKAETRVEPVVKTIRLAISPSDAFAAFTEDVSSWWPLATHSVGEDKAVSVRFEPEVGGRIVETTADGVEHEWGRVITWESGRRLEYSWYPGLPEDQKTTVEVSFKAAREGTEMILIHSGWEIRGASAEEIRDNYDRGWDLVLGRYVESV